MGECNLGGRGEGRLCTSFPPPTKSAPALLIHCFLYIAILHNIFSTYSLIHYMFTLICMVFILANYYIMLTYSLRKTERWFESSTRILVMFFIHEIIVIVILILSRELWDHFKDTITRITELNRFLQEKSSEDKKFVDFVKIKMRVLFSQHLSYKVNVMLIII